MKILKLLNNKYLSILLLIFLSTFNANAEDKPIDIWNIDENEIEESSISNNQNNLETNNTEISQPSIFDLQSEKEIETVQVSSDLNSQEIKIIGLYDPEDYNLLDHKGQLSLFLENLNLNLLEQFQFLFLIGDQKYLVEKFQYY